MSQIISLGGAGSGGTPLNGSGTTVGAVTADLITLPLGAVPGTYSFEIEIAGFEAGTPSGAGYRIAGSVRTTGAAAVLVPAQVVDEFEEAALVACSAALVVAANTAIIRVTGTVGLTINWKAIGVYVFAS